MPLILKQFNGQPIESTTLGESILALMQESEDDHYDECFRFDSTDAFQKFKRSIVFLLSKIEENRRLDEAGELPENYQRAINMSIGILKSLPVRDFFGVITEIDRLSLMVKKGDSLSDVAMRYIIKDRALTARVHNVHRVTQIARIISLDNIRDVSQSIKHLRIQIIETMFTDDQVVDDEK